MVFGAKQPQDLKRVESTLAQENGFEETIIWGHDDALPLRIVQAVEESPAASSCLETVAQFIIGSQFSDPELMDLVIDSEGTTLWDLHCKLSESLAVLWGFAVNFKFDRSGKISSTFHMPFESCRFKKPGEESPYIRFIKYNPYFGTSEYKNEFTKEYPVFDPKEVNNQLSGKKPDEIKDWPGQVYYYGKTSPTSKFYPKPKYWSAKEAIQADHKLEEFHNEELENGMFQSVLINVIGDPNKMSNNPRTMKEELQSDGTTIKLIPTKTVGEEFNDMMSSSFSGARKAGTAMVLWSNNANDAVKIQTFPTGITGERIIATQNSVTKTITIATRVPSILANISEGVSLGSDGNEMQKAVELMQSRTSAWRRVLENFYNKILFPNLHKKPKGEVEIQNYNPITVPVVINEMVWEFLNEEERVAFIKKNMPEIEIIRPKPQAVPATNTVTLPNTESTDEPKPEEAPVTVTDPNQEALDQLIRSMSRKDLSKFYGYVNDYKSGRATLEQAKVFLRAYKLTDEQIMLFLSDPEGDGV